MIGLEVKEARIFVRPGATDMRKQINGLAVIVEQQMEADVFSPALFVGATAGALESVMAILVPGTR